MQRMITTIATAKHGSIIQSATLPLLSPFVTFVWVVEPIPLEDEFAIVDGGGSGVLTFVWVVELIPLGDEFAVVDGGGSGAELGTPSSGGSPLEGVVSSGIIPSARHVMQCGSCAPGVHDVHATHVWTCLSHT